MVFSISAFSRTKGCGDGSHKSVKSSLAMTGGSEGSSSEMEARDRLRRISREASHNTWVNAASNLFALARRQRRFNARRRNGERSKPRPPNTPDPSTPALAVLESPAATSR
jgi:hypothetical protein